jgi:hypothetical protein
MAVGRVLGWQHIKSTAFDVRRTSTGYHFTGRGFGHGVGLCVVGAGHRAARGATADEILRFYFPGLRVQSYRSLADDTVASGGARPSEGSARPVPAAPSAAGKDVEVALPGGEQSERARIVQLIRNARDDIARRAGVAAPPVIRVTVHPTVESFGRATGQPWWVSGATDGAAIDLLPLTILQQRGQIERTLRHEVAHVLIDRALADRPLWVREGAAFYFADPLGSTPLARTDCPADAEFLRPLSAGAHRTAYARAEACFRRALASGRKWNEVR